MAIAVTAGSVATAAQMNTLITDVNAMLTSYALAADVQRVDPGVSILSSLIANLSTKLTAANNSTKNTSKTDLSGIAGYGVGTFITASLFNLIDQKALLIQSTCCACNCNYSCTCNCNYGCTCNCNYSCTCNCDVCYCGTSYEWTCVLPDQLLYGSKGPKTAKDIATGDYLFNENGEYSEVLSKWKMNNPNKIARLKGKSYTIDITDDHPMYVYDVDNDAMIKTSPRQLAHGKDLTKFKALFPKINRDNPNFYKDNFLYKLSIPLENELLKLIPYLILKGKFNQDNKYFIITFSSDERELIDRCLTYIKSIFNTEGTVIDNKIYIPTDESVKLSNIPIREIIISCTENNIPTWIYGYSDEALESMINELFIINKELQVDNKELAYQLRLLLFATGKESEVIKINNHYVIKVHGVVESYTNYYLLDISDLSLYDYSDLVYNFTLKKEHNYVGEIMIGDGFFCP